MKKQVKLSVLTVFCTALLVVVPDSAMPRARAADNLRYFSETGQTIRGKLLDFWEQHGGLTQFGFPITEELEETSEIGSETYTVQYFERAELELHMNVQPPDDVRLSVLGIETYEERYGCNGGPGQVASTEDPHYFQLTGKTVGGRFRSFWAQHGGVEQLGYPISDEFQETSPTDNKTYTVQYFERAEIEFHPENAGTPYEVLLSHLGASKYNNIQQLELDKAPPTIEVWADSGPSCPTCERDILGKDPATGETFVVADGPADQTQPVAYGRTVAWVEMSDIDYRIRIMIKNLDTGVTQVVSDNARSATQLQLNSEYLAWVLENWRSVSRVPLDPNKLQAYRLKTGELINVADSITPYGYDEPVFTLSRHWFVWSDGGGVKASDLDNGDFRDIPDDFTTHVEMKGGRITWSNYDGSFAYDVAQRKLMRMPPCKDNS